LLPIASSLVERLLGLLIINLRLKITLCHLQLHQSNLSNIVLYFGI
jgi:hypothetical protein